MTRKSLAVLVPAFNEGVVLKQTLKQLRRSVEVKDIYVVSDGSTDKTGEIARGLTENVLELPNNRGKAAALNLGIKHFKLTERYRFIMPMDADAWVEADFVGEALKAYQKHPDKKKACVVGRVQSLGKGIYGLYRVWEYEVVHVIYKQASAAVKAMLVCPGCATIYPSRVLKQEGFSGETKAEDMDFTFRLHRKKMGAMVYAPKAKVYTTDPINLGEYVKQLHRWYTGFWQAVQKYDIPWGGQRVDIEAALLAVEGLFNGLFVLVMISMFPLMLLVNSFLIYVPLALDMLLFMLPTVIYTMVKQRKYELIFYIPVLYWLRFLSALVFLRSFVHVVLRLDEKLAWFSPKRIKFEEG